MSRRQVVAASAAVLGAVTILLIVFVSGRPKPQQGAPGATTPDAPAGAERKITATLYFIAEDGTALVGMQQEVAYGGGVLEQARHILEAQLGRAPAPLASAIPEGTTLRALYVTERGDAFVDLSNDARAKHTGGTLDELFTVYAIVDALTVNLPAITRVQILVEGKEVDTLAGHVDLRHPLQKSLQWIRTDSEKDGT
jgi:spore germination protein GerM